ncbi:hypothetical protein LTR15_002883 [Elasticomyces elasticus]|nr:hypothetical protein LTR15_002883 [Elasticomyces elasticus]
MFAIFRYADGSHRLSALYRSKSTASIIISLCFFGVILAVLSLRALGHSDEPLKLMGLDTTLTPNTSGQGRFHFLIPATQSNLELCKLLLSAQILDYPTPVLINWGMVAEGDSSNTHLAKIQGFIDYLDALERSSETFDEDLVLIVDGYDVWFQLRRDVLIKRYYALNEAADARTAQVFGQDLFEKHDMRQTIVFGPDKICWPIDYGRPACWAAPLANMSDFAYGPQTLDGPEEYNHPRWLNSGTIIGPARHLRDLFNATLEGIHLNYDKHKDKGYRNSDQFYLAEVFGLQEWARLEKMPDLREFYKGLKYKYDGGNPSRRGPELMLSKTEYHVGIDHASVMFQSLAFWKHYLTWTRPSQSWLKHDAKANSMYQIQLPDDIVRSAPPYSTLPGGHAPNSTDKSWEDMEMMYNSVTKQVPAIIHMTAEKQFRHIWWQRLWFQPHAETLRLATVNATGTMQPAKRREIIGGYQWQNAEPPEGKDVKLAGLNGAWSDSAFWLSWRGICEKHEGVLYNRTEAHYNHELPKAPS